MAGPSLVGIHDRRVAERREVRPPLAVALHPRHAVILIGPRAELAETPAESAIRFLDVDAHQHALLLARVRRGRRKDVELVGVRERLAAERLHERARRIVDLEHLLLDAVLARPAAHHVGELRPVQVRVGHGVVAAEAAAFAHEAQDALAHLGIVVHHAAHVVEEHRIELLDLRILQQLLIVAERRLERAGVLRHQLDHVVAVRNRAVARIHLDVGDEQLARTCRLRRRLARNGRVDLRAHRGVEPIAAANLAGRGLQHVVDARRHRRPHHALERLQVLHHVGFGRADRLDGNRQRLEPRLVRGEEEVAEPGGAVAERHDARARIQRAAVGGRHVQQLALHDGEAVDRLDAGLRPAAEMRAHAHPLAAPLERGHHGLRIAFALERDVDLELLGKLVELGEIRRVGARDDQRRVDRLRELEHAAPHRGVGTDVVDAIRRDRLGDLAQAIDDRGALVGLKALVERLRDFEAGDLRARRLDAGDRPDIRLRERVGEGHPPQRRRRRRDAPAEPHVVVGRAHANRGEPAAVGPLRHRRHLRGLRGRTAAAPASAAALPLPGRRRRCLLREFAVAAASVNTKIAAETRVLM